MRSSSISGDRSLRASKAALWYLHMAETRSDRHLSGELSVGVM